jgi:hypothetical protein
VAMGPAMVNKLPFYCPSCGKKMICVRGDEGNVFICDPDTVWVKDLATGEVTYPLKEDG